MGSSISGNPLEHVRTRAKLPPLLLPPLLATKAANAWDCKFIGVPVYPCVETHATPTTATMYMLGQAEQHQQARV